MKINFSLFFAATLLFSVPQVFAAEQPEKVMIGTFSNMRFTEEHQYGADVSLFKEGGRLVGYFSHSAGLQGDTPSAPIKKIKYDPKSGSISFTAELSTGVQKINSEWVRTRDIFSFEGNLSETELSGILKHVNASRPDKPLTEENVVLTKTN
jgi:hypothetical protein